MRLFRKSQLENLAVTMAGAKLGDRLLVLGCGDPQLIAALALKTGLTGRACAVDESADRAAQAERVARAEGALIEMMVAPFSNLPLEDASFDLVVLRDVLAEAPAENRIRLAHEVWRVLRPGGRSVAIESTARGGGLSAMFRGGAAPRADTAAATKAFADAAFRGVRTLAEREGTAFVEAVKAAGVA